MRFTVTGTIPFDQLDVEELIMLLCYEPLDAFVSSAKLTDIAIPGTGETISYDPERKTGVAVSRLGTSMSIALGAYAFALRSLDS